MNLKEAVVILLVFLSQVKLTHKSNGWGIENAVHRVNTYRSYVTKEEQDVLEGPERQNCRNIHLQQDQKEVEKREGQERQNCRNIHLQQKNEERSQEKEVKKRNWNRWWWYKKSGNISKKYLKASAWTLKWLEKKKTYHGKFSGGAKGKGIIEPGKNLYNLHFRFEGKLFKFTNTRSNGWCMYSSLSAANHESRSIWDIRKMLANASNESSAQRASIEAIFEGVKLLSFESYNDGEIEKEVNDYHAKVASTKRCDMTWGDEQDLLVYSMLTGKKVMSLQNSEDGFRVVYDTRKILENIVEMPTKTRLNLQTWKEEEVTYIYYHPTGDVLYFEEKKKEGENESKNEKRDEGAIKKACNHYGALVPISSDGIRTECFWAYNGGKTDPVMWRKIDFKREVEDLMKRIPRKKKTVADVEAAEVDRQHRSFATMIPEGKEKKRKRNCDWIKKARKKKKMELKKDIGEEKRKVSKSVREKMKCRI